MNSLTHKEKMEQDKMCAAEVSRYFRGSKAIKHLKRFHNFNSMTR